MQKLILDEKSGNGGALPGDPLPPPLFSLGLHIILEAVADSIQENADDHYDVHAMAFADDVFFCPLSKVRELHQTIVELLTQAVPSLNAERLSLLIPSAQYSLSDRLLPPLSF